MKKIFLILIFTSYFLLLTSNVSAQQASLSLSPSQTELISKPGQNISIEYILKNSGDPTSFKLQVFSYKLQGQNNNLVLQNKLVGSISFSLQPDYLRLNELFFLKNNEIKKFTLQINLPEDAKLQDYYYALTAESQPQPAKEGVTSVRFKTILTSNIFITLTEDGKIDMKPKILLFDTKGGYKLNFFGKTYKIFDSFDKIGVILTVANNGKNLIRPIGQIILNKSFGKPETILIPSQIILSNSQKNLNFSSIFPASSFEGQLPTSYSLSASLTFGKNTPTLYASTSFLILPLKLIFIFITVIIVITFISKKMKIPFQKILN